MTLWYGDDVEDEENLVLYTWDGANWVDAACGPYQRDMDNSLLSVQICHLSEFALFVPAPEMIYLPMVLRG